MLGKAVLILFSGYVSVQIVVIDFVLIYNYIKTFIRSGHAVTTDLQVGVSQLLKFVSLFPFVEIKSSQ